MASSHPVDNSTSGAGSSTLPQDLHWGKWERSDGAGPMRHYSLEVVQHPIRARMCGFGDKDRRPLAPAAIARMVVRDEQYKILDVDDIDIDFFLVTCDLWSSDGTTEVNLVRNPAAASRRRNKDVASGTQSDDGGDLGISSRAEAAAPTVYYASEEGDEPSTSEPYYGSTNPQSWTPQQAPPPTLPSIGSIVPPVGGTQQPWPQQPPGAAGQYDEAGGQGGGYPGAPYPPGVRSVGNNQSWNASQYPVPPSAASTQVSFDPQGYSPGPTPSTPDAQGSSSAARSSSSHPAGNYTRTLVGPLTANAARLLDDKKLPGIFFTFQDLSVRTEGTFRLRLRLVNVGAAPAPNIRANRVHTNVSPVLAQTFTEAFMVFSAKKFPGVPPMTALSLEFGKQGQKLPLRNRPQGGRRGRDDEDGSGGGSEDEE